MPGWCEGPELIYLIIRSTYATFKKCQAHAIMSGGSAEGTDLNHIMRRVEYLSVSGNCCVKLFERFEFEFVTIEGLCYNVIAAILRKQHSWWRSEC